MAEDLALMAHLLRRAGFGSTREELEAYAAKGYEATVEELLHPDEMPDLPTDILRRYILEWRELNNIQINQPYWLYRMINSPRPLEEKICLFWHSILCVGMSKCSNGRQISIQLNKFRRHGLDLFPNLLLQLATDPAMIYYLDNCMSHKN